MRCIFRTTHENCLRIERLSFSLKHAVVYYHVRQTFYYTKLMIDFIASLEKRSLL